MNILKKSATFINNGFCLWLWTYAISCTTETYWSTTVRQRSGVSAAQIHRQHRLSSQALQHRHDYVPLSCQHTETNNWIEGRSNRHLANLGVPHQANCFDLPRHRSCRAPKCTAPKHSLVSVKISIYCAQKKRKNTDIWHVKKTAISKDVQTNAYRLGFI